MQPQERRQQRQHPAFAVVAAACGAWLRLLQRCASSCCCVGSAALAPAAPHVAAAVPFDDLGPDTRRRVRSVHRVESLDPFDSARGKPQRHAPRDAGGGQGDLALAAHLEAAAAALHISSCCCGAAPETETCVRSEASPHYFIKPDCAIDI